MKNIAVFFGGKSVEHDISILTAVEAMGHLDREAYAVWPVYIAKSNEWYTGEELARLTAYTEDFGKICGLKRAAVLAGSRTLFEKRNKKLLPLAEIDCALIACHGAYGEDGCLQGLLEIAGIPYTSCGPFASAACMDKHFMKRFFSSLGLSVLDHALLVKNAEGRLTDGERDEIARLGFPLVVKPASLGSSIGISFVSDEAELVKALEVAFLYDSRVIAEKALTDFREINCAAVSDGQTLFVSECEEPKTGGPFLSFSDKYLTGEKLTGQAQAEREFPARLTKQLRDTVRDTTAAIYRNLAARGVIRVDYMVKDGEVYVNEANTVPGALANYLFDFSYRKLLDKLILAATSYSERQDGLIRNFSSSVITGLKCNKITCIKS